MAGTLNTFLAGMAASPQLAGVTLLLGERFLSQEAAPPRCVLVPQRERFESPGGYAGDGLNVPRTIWRRIIPIEAHLWAKGTSGLDADDTDAVETLLQNVLQAIHQQSFTGFFYTATSGTFVDGALTSLGKGYVLTFEIQAPITLPADAEGVVVAFPETTARVDPQTGVIELNV